MTWHDKNIFFKKKHMYFHYLLKLSSTVCSWDSSIPCSRIKVRANSNVTAIPVLSLALLQLVTRSAFNRKQTCHQKKKYHAIWSNSLTPKEETSRPENLTFSWSWILRREPRSVAAHALWCNTLFKNSESPGS